MKIKTFKNYLNYHRSIIKFIAANGGEIYRADDPFYLKIAVTHSELPLTIWQITLHNFKNVRKYIKTKEDQDFYNCLKKYYIIISTYNHDVWNEAMRDSKGNIKNFIKIIDKYYNLKGFR